MAARKRPSRRPADCRYTYNPETNRLYLHILAWPLKYLHLAGLRNRVRYAQLLNDGSEVKTFDFTQHHRYPSGGRRHTYPGTADPPSRMFIHRLLNFS